MNKFPLIILISLLATLTSNNKHTHNKHHKIVNIAYINDNNPYYVQNTMNDFVKATSHWSVKKWREFLVYYLQATLAQSKKWTANSFKAYAKLWVKGNPKWWKAKEHWTQK